MTAPTPKPAAAEPDGIDGDAVVNRLAAKLAEAHVRIAVLEVQLDAARTARTSAS